MSRHASGAEYATIPCKEGWLGLIPRRSTRGTLWVSGLPLQGDGLLGSIPRFSTNAPVAELA